MTTTGYDLQQTHAESSGTLSVLPVTSHYTDVIPDWDQLGTEVRSDMDVTCHCLCHNNRSWICLAFELYAL